MSALTDILTALRGDLKRIEGKVDAMAVVLAHTSERVDEVREWLLEEEQARIAVGKTVMDHESRLPRAVNGNGR